MNVCPVIGPRGEHYPSQSQAARELGLSRRTVMYHLNTHGSLKLACTGKSRPGTRNACKPITLGPRTYPSRVEAAEALGITVAQLKRWIGPNAKPAYREMLLAAMMRASA